MRKRLTTAALVIFALALVLIVYMLLRQCNKEEIYFEPEPEPEPSFEYGIVIDSMMVIKDEVRRNQSLSDILSHYNVGGGVIHQLAGLSKPVFDVRRMRAGHPYTIMLSNDTIPEVLYFIYEESPVSYIVYGIHDSLFVSRGEKLFTRETRTASGVINSSLWNAMVENGTNPTLAIEMSEVYAWTIDFFGIQRGDNYKVVYEELSVEGQSIGVGKVLASCFHHMGTDLYAFRFSYEDNTGYYDENGENLQRTFLKAPLRYKRISSKFSHSRMHPILKIRRPHLGVDYAADHGTPVQTIGDGTVIEKGWDKKGGGNFVKIRHNSTYTTLYMHLAGFAKGLQTGSRVQQGDIIGYVGSTGLSTGPHLDFRFFRNGQPIDPLKVESPPADPVDPDYLGEFFVLRDSLKVALDTTRANR
ncbi:MAG: peptidoglycan DD-metalloendopeptidase family protein [Bacteroidales bacterium]|nr:peptidoglycan DD-metalloendopeptidase family protein [Bacteroidales bacterium]